MDIYVLNNNLIPIGIVDTYKSLIWAKRYRDIGDCELYLPASSDNIALLSTAKYLARRDDDMVCRIKKIEIDTDATDGNYLIISGYDVKDLLNQRIIWDTSSCKGNVEDFIRSQIQIAGTNAGKRQFKKGDGTQLLYLAQKAGFTDRIDEQVSYKNLGEKIREYCEKFGWGYRVFLNSFSLSFQLYKGADLSGSVIFSNEFENLSTTKYVKDSTKIENVALTAGEGEGAKRVKVEYGTAEGTERYEFFVDAKDIQQTITYKSLTEDYPLVQDGGQGYLSGSVYMVHRLDVQIVDDDHLAALRTKYPNGQVITIDNQRYYRLTDIAIADLESTPPSEYTAVKWRDIIYTVFLLNRSAEKAKSKAATESFEGTIAPNVTFVYKSDYSLGDIVTVKNEFGITARARIIEIVEVDNDSGYTIQPKFEYKEVNYG